MSCVFPFMLWAHADCLCPPHAFGGHSLPSVKEVNRYNIMSSFGAAKPQSISFKEVCQRLVNAEMYGNVVPSL